jgi:serine/threonine protein kinase
VLSRRLLVREVAVKVLPASFAKDAERLRRFEKEARTAGSLSHPNLLTVFDVGTHEGSPYIVSELLEGGTLRERLGASPLPVRKAVDYAIQIAHGLAAAHEKGVVHRDLKPENVFVTRDGRVKILDFGLAKLVRAEAGAEGRSDLLSDVMTATAHTEAGVVLGTAGYMSPEQARAKPADHRSDVFSFGAILYELLSARRAFRGQSAVETMGAIINHDPALLSETNPEVPPALERIVAHCLEKDPEQRFQSARDLARRSARTAARSISPSSSRRARAASTTRSAPPAPRAAPRGCWPGSPPAAPRAVPSSIPRSRRTGAGWPSPSPTDWPPTCGRYRPLRVRCVRSRTSAGFRPSSRGGCPGLRMAAPSSPPSEKATRTWCCWTGCSLEAPPARGPEQPRDALEPRCRHHSRRRGQQGQSAQWMTASGR